MGRYDTDGSSALAPNDPYNEMEGADYRPKFTVLEGGKSSKPSRPSSASPAKTNSEANSADDSRNLLRNAENNALSSNKVVPFYSGVGRPAIPTKVAGRKQKKKGSIYAFLIIIMLLAGGGAFLGSSHSLLAPALENLVTKATNTQHASFSMRSRELISGEANKQNATKTSAKIPDGAEAKLQQGNAATFFDDSANDLYDDLTLSRNVFNQYEQTSNSETDKKNFRDTLQPRYDNNSSTLNNAFEEEVEVEVEVPDEDGSGNTHTEIQTKIVRQNQTDLDGRSNVSIAEAEAKARNFLDSASSSAQKAAKTAAKTSQVADLTCMAMRVGGVISSVVAANEIYQSINYFMNFMESISKMKYGQGSKSAINEVLNTFTQVVTATHPNINSDSGAAESITGAPVQANSLQRMLAYAPADASVNEQYSIERTGNAITRKLNMSPTAVATCDAESVGVAAMSIITTISTFGVSVIGQVLLDVATGIVSDIAISAILSFITPTIAKSLFTNIFDTATGIPSGELFARGAAAANTRVARTGSGQSISSAEVAVAYERINQEVIAQEAAEDRANRSPFDITSENTFLGSIAYSLLPVTLLKPQGTTSFMTSINTITRSTSSALASLSGTASAMTNDSYMTPSSDNNCPNLEKIGAVGESHCIPITTTDPTTIKITTDDPDYVAAIDPEVDNCDSDGYCKINENGDLAKYISYCANRDSPFGIVDMNILNALEIGGSFWGNVPVVSDFLTIINKIHDVINIAWATGERCGNTEKNQDFWNSKGKYYQRYIEDQRVFAWADAYGDKPSPVVSYMESYREKHPLDNSPAGYLARISGITKDDAEGVIALVVYSNFLENYDPSTRLAMLTSENETKNSEDVSAEVTSDIVYFEQDSTTPVAVDTSHHYIIYNDIRNRSYAA